MLEGEDQATAISFKTPVTIDQPNVLTSQKARSFKGNSQI
jgi:hypothetical protein